MSSSKYDAEKKLLSEDDLETESTHCSTECQEKPHTPSFKHQFSKIKFVVLIAAILLSNFSTAIDSSLSASAHVAIASSFNRTNLSAYPVNAFLISTLTFQPLYARISDHVGRRIPYLFASGIFALGLVLSAIASSWWRLVASRALCGLGVAGVMTMGSILLTDTVGLVDRGYYQSINYVVYGAGSALGSGSGGTIVQNFGWAWAYKIQIPISLLAFVLLAATVPSPTDSTSGNLKRASSFGALDALRNFDWRGSICLMCALVSLFSFLTTGGNVLPWSHGLVILAGTASIIFTAFFVNIERKAEKPILPLDVLFKFPARNILVTGFLFSMVNYTIMYNTTLFFQSVIHDTVQSASTRLIIPSISFTISSTLTGSFIARYKSPVPTLQLSQGLLFFGTFGLVLMSYWFPAVQSPSWLYNLFLIMPAIGVGMIAPSIVLTLLNITDPKEHAVANGSLIMMRSLGVFVATALSTTTLQNVFRWRINNFHYNEKTGIKIEKIRQNVELILKLKEPLRSEVSGAYSTAFTAVFALCAIAATLIIITMARVNVKGFGQEKGEEAKHS